MKKKDALVGYYFNNNLMHFFKGDKSLRESVYNRKLGLIVMARRLCRTKNLENLLDNTYD